MAGVVRAATGRHIDDYARANLFEPIGITDFHWKKTPTGHPDTEGGLHLAAEDLARLGLLYLHDGVWDGRRILPAGWVKDATTRHARAVAPGWDYGYQWWIRSAAGEEVWAGRGFGGQLPWDSSAADGCLADAVSRFRADSRIPGWRPTMRVIRHYVCGIAVVATLALSVLPASAQDRPLPALDLAAGWVGFADDGIVSEFPIGGGFRWYLSPRISIGPEVTFISGESHSHQVITGNLTFDLLAPRNGAPRVTPFLVVGGGLFRTSEDFANEPYASTEGAFTVGGGIRAPVGNRVALGADVRLGWEPHLRITGFVGVGLGRRP